MLDTLILQLKQGNYVIFEKERFILQKSKMGFCKWVNNPEYKNSENYDYKPRLTLLKQGAKLRLKIEFSAPKIMRNNNVDELVESDFELVIDKLQKKMKNMGVNVFSHALKRADVFSFHPSKNIELKNGQTSTYILKMLDKVDVNNKFDLNKKEFHNGEVLQYYTNSHGLAIYDKKNDLRKEEKRAFDKDRTKQDKELFKMMTATKEYFELLRVEVRLSYRKKMNEVLKTLGYKTDPCFEDVFNSALCKNIVNYYWDNFFENNLFLFSANNDIQVILEKIFAKNPNITPTKALALTCLHQASISSGGLRGLKNIFNNRRKNSWSIIKKRLNFFDDVPFIQDNVLNDVSAELKEFKTFKYNK